MARTVRKGEYVQVQKIILAPAERAPQVPADTKKVPLELKVKGFLLDEEAALGQEVTIRTMSGRRTRGTLTAVNPRYTHDFAGPEPALLTIGMELKSMLWGSDFDV